MYLRIHSDDITTSSFIPVDRQSFDSTINNHGKRLIQICKSCNLRIINGRTKGDSLGKPTFHGKNGTSVVDYIICAQDLLQTTNNFIVKAPTYPSDHRQKVTWIKTNSQYQTNSNNDFDGVDNLSQKLPLQFIWEDNAAESFIVKLSSPHTQNNLAAFMDSEFALSEDGVSDCATQFQNIIIESARKSFKIKKVKHRQYISNVMNKKWFDADCNLKRQC